MTEEKATLEPRWFWYAVSFILAPVGIILGITYRRKEALESKDFGKKTIIAAVAGVVICVAFYVVWLFVLGAAAWM